MRLGSGLAVNHHCLKSRRMCGPSVFHATPLLFPESRIDSPEKDCGIFTIT